MKNTRLIGFFATIACAFVFSSCTITKSKTSKSMDVYGNGVMHTPVICDLEVGSSRVSGSANTASESLESAKQFAIADALEKSQADILVEPRFSTETRNGRTEVTATGYPAVYKNFRSVVPADTTLVRIGEKQVANTSTAISSKSKTSQVALAAVAVITALSAFLFGIFLASI